MHPFFRRLIPGRIKEYMRLVDLLNQRVQTIENGMQNRRNLAVYDLTDFLVGSQIKGDYCEFGVYKGTTFSNVYRFMATIFPDMHFYAFDSFEGLPKPKGLDAVDGYTSNFHENEFSASEEEFYQTLNDNNVDLSRVTSVKGWFDKTLSESNSSKYGIKKISAAWIDCDLYESTVPVLDFIYPYLEVGSVVIFDDWRCFRNLPDFGEQRACREWLEKNPNLTLNELFSFGFHGCAFTVGSK